MNKNPYLLPLSIIVTGIIIAGAVIYKPGQNQPEVIQPIDYVELAGELGLNTDIFKTCVDSRTFKGEVEKDLADGDAAGVRGTPATFINGRKIDGAQPYSAYKAAIEDAFDDTKPLSDVNLDEIKPSADDDSVLGDANAPVTMVIFGDFECPYCEQAYRTAEKQARDEYVAKGKVKMVFRDYPLTGIHPAAQPAAEAAQCAGAQGKYWQYHDALFENQDRLPY